MQLKDVRGVVSKRSDGYGFIKYQDRYVFFHSSQVREGIGNLNKGDEVMFDFGLARNPAKPPEARNIRVIRSVDDVVKALLLAEKVQAGGAA